MSIQRIFMDLARPALEAASGFLLSRYRVDKSANLGQAIVVVPGRRAGRRLLETLVDAADRTSLVLTPPQIETVGRLPEQLYQRKRPFASDVVQQLVWAHTLRVFDRKVLRDVISRLPDSEADPGWLELGKLLQNLHRELAADVLNFADVRSQGAKVAGFNEERRWQILAQLQRRYLDHLDRLEMWDRQTARRVAIDHRECRTDKDIVLIGTADMDRTMRRMLDQVADRVTALVYAPAEWQDRFDEHGCLKPDAWQSVELNIPDESLIGAEDPVDQADVVARRIAGYERRYRAEEITIGLPDERIVPQIVRQLDECGLPNRYGPGQALSQSGVYRMLEDLAALQQTGGYAESAALVRHPDVQRWLESSGVQPSWIEELDAYYNKHLPRRIDDQWLGDQQRCEVLRSAFQRVAELTAGLSGPPKPLDQWLPAVRGVVLQVYGRETFDLEFASDRVAWQACSAVLEAIDELAQIPAAIMPTMPAAEVLRLLLDRLGSRKIAEAASDAAIVLVGWLELPLDDAPALIVTSFNEGFVPSSVNADLFLPGGLRSALGLDDNARRYARDAYAVTTLLAPWRETSFIVARRNQDNDPLAPSRLLFAVPKQTVSQRALRLFAESKARPVRRPLAGALTSSRRDPAFEVPRPQPLPEPIERMSVTAFSAYLACPYRFYLTHVLRLERVDDNATELDGAAFGSLAHDVLERFGTSDQRNSSDVDAIYRELNHLLNQLVRGRFGKHPGAPVLVQIEQLRLRLKAFAQWQAKRAQEGWRIEHAELSFSDRPGKLDVDGRFMLLTGRIDRIDVHESTQQRQILDYKTGDAGDKPERTHRRWSGEWIDLQLPLYRHLAREVQIDGPVELGYVVLPKNVANVGLALAEWSEADLADADETARQVVRRVRQQHFGPPTEPPPPYSGDLAAICMDGVFGRKKWEE